MTPCYLEAFQATGNADYARVARETCDYVLREMTDPAGGFYSTQDADSEGEEGKFFVWTPEEIEAVLGAEAAETFATCTTSREPGNFEGHNILESAQDDRSLRQAAAPRSRTNCEPNWPPRGPSCWPCASGACSRAGRQSAGRLERPDDRCAGPGGRCAR